MQRYRVESLKGVHLPLGLCITKHNQLSIIYHDTKISQYDMYYDNYKLFHEIDLKFTIEYIYSA